MAYKLRKTAQGEPEILFSGWEQGIAPSPYEGIGDIKNANISSIKGEISLAYGRTRIDTPATSGSFITNGSHSFAYAATTLNSGTWILAGVQTGTTGLVQGNYYYCKQDVVGVSYYLYSDFGTTQITGDSGNGTAAFTTLEMGIPIDYTIENYGGLSSNSWRYFVLDSNGVIWVAGTSTAPAGTVGGLSASSTWSAITPHGSTPDCGSGTIDYGGSISIMYATDTGGFNKIQHTYMLVFTDSQILWFKSSAFTDATHGWPSNTGATASVWQSLNYSNYPHKSALGNDQVLYFTDGPGIGIVQQKTGQSFDPLTASTYNYVDATYLMSPTDAATRIAFIPAGNGLSLVVGGQQNNIYIYPTYQNSSGSGAAPISIIWTPESDVQYLLQTNNYVLIFTGNKGNIYLTNGSSVVPLMTVPDYIAGAKSFVQDPYFIWGGAMYLRGRVFFSIQDQNTNHTGNCGGIYSFVPSLSYFTNQDTGLALRMESGSSLWLSQEYQGCAPIIFAGQETGAQKSDGPQYLSCWSQGPNNSIGSVNSIDFSSTTPITGTNQFLIETDAIPIGTLLDKKTWNQFEIKFSSALVTGETVAVNYRTDLESAWSSIGTMIYEPSRLSVITNGLNMQSGQMLGVQLVQFQILGTGIASSPSWIRIKECYLR